jgi:hypothetical protein
VDDAGAKLEARAEPVYHSIWGKDADELTLAPFTQNSGHPRTAIHILKTLAGHRSISTTAAYLYSSTSQLKAAVELA